MVKFASIDNDEAIYNSLDLTVLILDSSSKKESSTIYIKSRLLVFISIQLQISFLHLESHNCVSMNEQNMIYLRPLA